MEDYPLLAVIGGSGLYDMPGLENRAEKKKGRKNNMVVGYFRMFQLF